MRHCIGCDVHKEYSVFVAVNERGERSQPVRVSHRGGQFANFLGDLPAGCEIAVETVGFWYWIVDDMVEAGHVPWLTDAKKAHQMMGGKNKFDRLDAGGLGVLLHNGTLPTVWIASREVRDQRELCRMRMALVGIQTKLKNRVHACFQRHGVLLEPGSIFGSDEAPELCAALERLPPATRYSVERQRETIRSVQAEIQAVQQRMRQAIRQSPEIRLLMTMPGVGEILALVVALEIGDIERFPTAARLVSYCGLVPRVFSSGGRTWHGAIAPDVNRTLRWAFVEAANTVARYADTWPQRSIARLYQRLAAHKHESVAKIAVARELAQAAFWMLKKKEVYHELPSAVSSPRQARRAPKSIETSEE